MSEYQMPVLSEKQREELIEKAKLKLEIFPDDGLTRTLYQIALASLTANPAGWGLKSLEDDRYGSWLMSTPREQSYLIYQPHKYENVQLYTAPPVPIKQEGEQ